MDKGTLPQVMSRDVTQETCIRALKMGADWLEGVAQERRPNMPEYGSLRTDYSLRHRRWWRTQPVWRTAQAGRALIAAHRVTGAPRYLKGAERAAAYLTTKQVLDPGSPVLHGMVNAHEHRPDRISVSAIVRSIRLFTDIADVTGDRHWDERFLMAMQWVFRNAYLLQGKVMESFSPATGQFDSDGPWGPNSAPARPLIDDACFYEAYLRSGEASYERAFRTIAERLSEDEAPPGHWAAYPPSDRRTGLLVTRQAFWWGRPMLVAGNAFSDERFLSVATRTAQWFMEYQNLDGGFYAQNWTSGYHNSFDLSASAAACACLVWFDLYDRTGDDTYLEAARDSLRFVLRMQFSQAAEDVNLRGAFVESLDAPAPPQDAGPEVVVETPAPAEAAGGVEPFFDGTERLSVHVADVATTFAVQALARAVDTPKLFMLGD